MIERLTPYYDFDCAYTPLSSEEENEYIDRLNKMGNSYILGFPHVEFASYYRLLLIIKNRLVMIDNEIDNNSCQSLKDLINDINALIIKK
jgi:hypothetical protein